MDASQTAATAHGADRRRRPLSSLQAWLLAFVLAAALSLSGLWLSLQVAKFLRTAARPWLTNADIIYAVMAYAALAAVVAWAVAMLWLGRQRPSVRALRQVLALWLPVGIAACVVAFKGPLQRDGAYGRANAEIAAALLAGRFDESAVTVGGAAGVAERLALRGYARQQASQQVLTAKLQDLTPDKAFLPANPAHEDLDDLATRIVAARKLVAQQRQAASAELEFELREAKAASMPFGDKHLLVVGLEHDQSARAARQNRTWDLYDSRLAALGAGVDMLRQRRGAWIVADGKAVFPDARLRSEYNEHMRVVVDDDNELRRLSQETRARNLAHLHDG